MGVIHHAAFIGASLINGIYFIFIFQFSWLILGELSSVFLNWRWFLIQSGRGDSATMKYCSLAFASLFFSTRVIAYGLGLADLFIHRRQAMAVSAPKPFIIIVLSLLVGGYVLNLFWMRSFYKLAIGGGKKIKAKKI